jgi:cytochrome d ubiquinol oxidase subunit I
MDFDALLLSRVQFAFTIAYHIIFPSFTIGLACFLAVLEGLWLFTRREAFKVLYLFWVKIFAISFGMGVVTGVVMSYQLGTNWSGFSAVAGPVIGPQFAFEVLTAFFLEASFLGVMLFGWRRVGPGLHFAATCLVAFGTILSAFWIISANSWMQYPQGFERLADGTLRATDYWRVVFTDTFPERLAHMLLAAFLTTALVVGGASAWRLLRQRDDAESRIALRMAIGMFALVAPLQLVVGDLSGKEVLEVQPAKLAAIEAFWETRTEQPFHLVAWPDRAAEKNHWELSIPKIGSWITAGRSAAEIKGLKAFPPEDRPPVAVVFWAFRVMVGLGLAMIGLGLWGAFLIWRGGGPERHPLFLRAAILIAPTGFVAVIAGWIVAEVGRQPWVVTGVLRTRDAVSPITAGEVGGSLTAVLVVYAIVFGAGVLYILRLMAEGPQPVPSADTEPPLKPRPPGYALGAAPDEPEERP